MIKIKLLENKINKDKNIFFNLLVFILGLQFFFFNTLV